MTTEHQYPENFQARVVGEVQLRIGDGQLETIPFPLDVQVGTAIASFVLSWTSEGQPVTITLSKPEFEYHVDNGNIVVDFQVEFNNSGQILTTRVPFRR